MENLLIKDIVKANNLPFKTLIVCNQLGLVTLNDIIEYYEANNTFLKPNICGQKTNQNLINIYNKYTKILNDDLKNEQTEEDYSIDNIIIPKDLSIIIEQLNNIEKEIINNKIKININNLSVRSKNAINRLLNYNYNIENVYKIILSDKNFYIINIRNIGFKSIPELEYFIREIHSDLENIYTIKKGNENINTENNSPIHDKLYVEYVLSTIQTHFKISENKFKPIAHFYYKNGTFPIFKIIDLLINNGFIYNSKEIEVFKYINRYTNNIGKTKKEIGKITNLTSERIRQLKNNISNNFELNYSFLSKLNLVIKYDFLNSENNCIYINDNIINDINIKEEVDFSKLFYFKIFSVVLKDTHNLFGDFSFFARYPVEKTFINDKYFLISKSTYNYDALLKDLFHKLNNRISKTHSYNFNEYISKFYLNETIIDIDKISAICKLLIKQTFDIDIASNGNIVFYRNTIRFSKEYLIEILEDFKKPMHIQEIFNECIKRGYPFKSIKSVHSVFLRESEIFGLKGSSVYGLKKYNKYYGTIGNVAEQYLREKGKPIPFKELENFLMKELIIKNKYSIYVVLFRYKFEKRFVLTKNKMASLAEWDNK